MYIARALDKVWVQIPWKADLWLFLLCSGHEIASVATELCTIFLISLKVCDSILNIGPIADTTLGNPDFISVRELKKCDSCMQYCVYVHVYMYWYCDGSEWSTTVKHNVSSFCCVCVCMCLVFSYTFMYLSLCVPLNLLLPCSIHTACPQEEVKLTCVCLLYMYVTTYTYVHVCMWSSLLMSTYM